MIRFGTLGSFAGVAALALVAACTNGGSGDEVGRLDVIFSPAAFVEDGAVSRVSVAIPEDGRTADLELVGRRWQASIEGVSAGMHHVVGTAFGPDGRAYFSRDLPGVQVWAERPTLAAVEIDPALISHPLANLAPRVSTLVASPTSVGQGDPIHLTATVTDPDIPDRSNLTYLFTATGSGWSFSSATGTADPSGTVTTDWTPQLGGSYTITARITDPSGAFATKTVNVTVTAAKATAQVNIGFDQSPNITNITSDNPNMGPNTTTNLAVTASDPDGDQLTYAWSSACGTFGSPSSATTTFTVSSSPPSACKASVTVSDPTFGVNTGSIGFNVGAAIVPGLPPIIDATVQSTATPKPGEHVILQVHAHDPQGQTLTPSVSATGGATTSVTASGQSSTDNYVLVDVSAGCGPVSSTITVTFTNQKGLSSSTQFSMVSGGSLLTTSPTPLGTGTNVIDQLAINGSTLYFSTKTANSIRSIPVTGGTATSRRPSGEPVTDMVADGTALYWTNGTANQVKRQPHSSSTVTTLFTGGTGATGRKPSAIAMSGTTLFWASSTTTTTTISSLANAATATSTAVATQGSLSTSLVDGIAADGSSYFVADKAHNVVSRFTGVTAGATTTLTSPAPEVVAGGSLFVGANDGVYKLSESTNTSTQFLSGGAATHLWADGTVIYAVIGNAIYKRDSADANDSGAQIACNTAAIGELVTDSTSVYALLPTTGQILKLAK